MKEQSDNELVRLYQSGDANAFGIISNRHFTFLKTHAFHIVKDWETAEDIVQDSLLKAMLSIREGGYQDKGSLKAWLMVITHNDAINQYRRMKKNPAQFSLSSTDAQDKEDDSAMYSFADNHEPSMEDMMIEEEVSSELATIIDKLPEIYREILILRYQYELKYEEIAAYTMIPLGSVKTRIHVGTRLLRQLFMKAVA